MHPVTSYLLYDFIIISFLAMEALGITNYNKTPTGKDKDRISSETFCQEAYVHLILIICFSLYIYIGKSDLTN